jgi:hypothetical protein
MPRPRLFRMSGLDHTTAWLTAYEGDACVAPKEEFVTKMNRTHVVRASSANSELSQEIENCLPKAEESGIFMRVFQLANAG